MPSVLLTVEVLSWPVLILLITYILRRQGRQGVGLTLAYLLSLSLIHLPGAVVHIFPWYHQPRLDMVQVGFTATLIGLLAFMGGVLILTPLLEQLLHLPRTKPLGAHQGVDPQNRSLPRIYLLLGLLSTLLVYPLLSGVPTLRALLGSTNLLLVVGLCLAIWQGWVQGDQPGMLRWLLLASFLPVMTVLRDGYLGYGIVNLLVIFLFVLSFTRFRRRLLGVGIFVLFIGLSTFVTYMRDRSEIRTVVWSGDTLARRVQAAESIVVNFEWFNIYNQEHLTYLDGRLNQNWLVGAAIFYLDHGFTPFARGATFWEALQSLVPRILWPDKPVYAGSPGLVSAYTGITFNEGTSVGVGQVMEFYINFGTPGLIIGFLLLGWVVHLIDLNAARQLQEANWRRFALWFLPGLSFLQAGGSLVEITAGAGASLGAIFLINQMLTFLRRRRAAPAPLLVTTRSVHPRPLILPTADE